MSIEVGDPRSHLRQEDTWADCNLNPDEKMVYNYDFGDDWVHTITVEGHCLARPAFQCLECTGHGVAEDVNQKGWRELKAAYQTASPNEEQQETMKWYERHCSNGDREGLANGREHVWDQESVNCRLEALTL